MKELTAEPCTTDVYYLGESCRWDEVRHELCWVNVDEGQFFRATADGPTIDIHTRYDVGGHLTALAPMKNRSDGWIVAKDQSIYKMSEGGDLRELASPEAHNEGEVRTNDGVVDPWGRFWIGSMAFDEGEGRGSLYRYDTANGLTTVLEGVTISNGIGWSPDRRTMYYNDSGPGTIFSFDVDGSGDISNQSTFAQLDVPTQGAPDGLCVDSDGTIWVAVWGGYQVRGYAPSGEQVAHVVVDTAQPSCCTIGGANGTTLYITTAREHMSEEQLAAEPDAGRLFCVDVGVTGQSINPFH
jgi:sugar lactone lactonase YvrE